VIVNVLVIDNYDSFAYNLVQYLGELGATVDVVRNDRATVDELLARGFDRLVISPGPCTPAEAGISVEAFGGRVLRGKPIHGKEAAISHDGRTLFEGLPEPLTVGRYHSLIAAPELPDSLELSADYEGIVMAVRHRELPAEGVQFHPESVLTPAGKRILANFLDHADGA
jgi:anthranilate/para-aminobenzoate synthase component II